MPRNRTGTSGPASRREREGRCNACCVRHRTSWSLAATVERKTLVDELIEAVHIYPDRLTVKVH